MLNTSTAVADAMTASSRKIAPEAEIDLVDPDIVYGASTASGQHPYSRPEQMYNHVLEGTHKYATAERGRMVLDGTWDFFPADPMATVGEVGIIGNTQSDENGYFADPPWAQLNVSSLSILQAASVCFTGIHGDGYGIDFTIDIYSGAQIVHSQAVTNNSSLIVPVDGFTVYDVTAIRATFTRWSLPGRYVRAVEIIAGLFEVWGSRMFYGLDLKYQVDMSCATLPYGTAIIDIYNEKQRFNPRNKSGLFQSIEARQAIPIRVGVRLPDGTYEYMPAGTFYQQNGGWETSHGTLLMRFKLVDIVGLIASRKFNKPATIPTTVRGWIEAILSQLGDNFTNRYIIDGDLADVALTCSVDDISSVSCGDLLRYICMVIGAYPRADKSTGYLRISKPPTLSGVATTRGNMSAEPTQKANEDIAYITFKLNDGNGTQNTIGGTNSAASKTLNIANPFIKTATDAQAAAKHILRYYGGQKTEFLSRGDLRAEMGDPEVVELGIGETAGGNRHYFQYKISNKGTIKDAQNTLIQGIGGATYNSREFISQSGTYSAANVNQLYIIIGAAGDGGENGKRGEWLKNGDAGVGGRGGKIYTATININPGQTFTVNIGEGGEAGQPGAETTFGNYSSANGEYFESWIELETGNVYGAVGATGTSPTTTPIAGANGTANTGNGGSGGSGGAKEVWTSGSPSYPVAPAVEGGKGGAGGSGFVIVYYNI